MAASFICRAHLTPCFQYRRLRRHIRRPIFATLLSVARSRLHFERLSGRSPRHAGSHIWTHFEAIAPSIDWATQASERSCLKRVKMRNSRCEEMFSAILPTADIQRCHRQGRSKAYRVTLQIPACVTVSATARLDPAVNGTISPSAPTTKCWTIPCGRMR